MSDLLARILAAQSVDDLADIGEDMGGFELGWIEDAEGYTPRKPGNKRFRGTEEDQGKVHYGPKAPGKTRQRKQPKAVSPAVGKPKPVKKPTTTQPATHATPEPAGDDPLQHLADALGGDEAAVGRLQARLKAMTPQEKKAVRARLQAALVAKPKAARKPAKPAAKSTVGGTVDVQDLPSLASLIHDAGRNVPDIISGRTGDRKTYAGEAHKPSIADLYDALAPRLSGATLDEFKAALVRANQAGLISLSRLDLPDAARDRKSAERSETRHLNSTFHSVLMPDKPVQSKPQADSQTAGQASERTAAARDRLKTMTVENSQAVEAEVSGMLDEAARTMQGPEFASFVEQVVGYRIHTGSNRSKKALLEAAKNRIRDLKKTIQRTDFGFTLASPDPATQNDRAVWLATIQEILNVPPTVVKKADEDEEEFVELAWVPVVSRSKKGQKWVGTGPDQRRRPQYLPPGVDPNRRRPRQPRAPTVPVPAAPAPEQEPTSPEPSRGDQLRIQVLEEIRSASSLAAVREWVVRMPEADRAALAQAVDMDELAREYGLDSTDPGDLLAAVQIRHDLNTLVRAPGESVAFDLDQKDPQRPVAKEIAADAVSQDVMRQVVAEAGGLNAAGRTELKKLEKEAARYIGTKDIDPEERQRFLLSLTRRNVLRKVHTEANKKARATLLGAMKPEKPWSPEFHERSGYRDRATPAGKLHVKRGVDFVRGLCADKGGAVRVEWERPFFWDDGRGYCRPSINPLNDVRRLFGGPRVAVVNPGSGAYTDDPALAQDATEAAIHELGHVIEDSHPVLKRRVQDFLDYRLGDEEIVPLDKLFPASGHHKGEKGARDRFDKHFALESAYYVGREYEKGDTEIVSMGLEALYADPLGFMQDDPEYAAFVLGVLRSK